MEQDGGNRRENRLSREERNRPAINSPRRHSFDLRNALQTDRNASPRQENLAADRANRRSFTLSPLRSPLQRDQRGNAERTREQRPPFRRPATRSKDEDKKEKAIKDEVNREKAKAATAEASFERCWKKLEIPEVNPAAPAEDFPNLQELKQASEEKQFVKPAPVPSAAASSEAASWGEQVEEHETKQNQVKGHKLKYKRRLMLSESSDASEESLQTKKKGKGVSELESDKATLIRREKQIEYGKESEAYHRYIHKVPREKRDPKIHPRTPNKYVKYSRRSWDTQVRIWRRQLHIWDQPKIESASNSPVSPSNDLLHLDSSAAASEASAEISNTQMENDSLQDERKEATPQCSQDEDFTTLSSSVTNITISPVSSQSKFNDSAEFLDV